ncbi:helix-turn-helix domain-containing protein [Lederbergia lenta]|uniref:helix-turn-helix domain-containing protein n=1 Tax=Lederbergia lenta TaxID=1467 RepID=UPI002040F503|nr:helix-turn-helix transcriptional regulator [Lederbergia lenta]MCM3110011.1 helix-turn-helix domain-containing protein [Lederbergia lenta]
MKKLEGITVYFDEKTLLKIRNIVALENTKNLLWKPERFAENQLQDFITGCVYLYIEQIESQDMLAGLDDLGKPFRLQNRLKEYIQSKNISQSQLADITNISNPNISQIVNNINQPSLDYFLRIWIALGCPSIKEIFYREVKE